MSCYLYCRSAVGGEADRATVVDGEFGAKVNGKENEFFFRILRA